MAHLAPRIAALTIDITPGQTALKLLPAGTFRARDGRPAECPYWQLDAALAAALVIAAAQRQTRYVIDYEHQTLNSPVNGQPAPAAGWFGTLEWREDGLYATDVQWTARAAAMIDALEYRYLSPVFAYDKAGNVIALLHVALTNNPALDELPELQVAALSRLVSSTSLIQEDTTMDELIEQLRWLLNLPVGVTADEIKTHLQKLIDQLSDGKGMAAASVDLRQLLASQQTQIAALTANQADPARFVPVDTMRALQQQVASLSAQLQSGSQEQLIAAALADGRLLPAQEAWARELAGSNLAALTSYLATAPRIAALSGTQTGGKPPASDAPTTPDADTLAICQQFGLDPAALKD
ncbi:Mu-like prophage FluMu I protein [Aquitalea magnusonii]|uniref:Mu-like prophage FluMu I protein n=1 Tax=Aquitalea magnusonii TaxID=332411 RepID=A0A3G9GF55_9NEIS|nr:phage protease [Aquitalea magnusonii]BBF84891.1 Mu-like prophage FluMu I protein [Aquitalea magnusonii]